MVSAWLEAFGRMKPLPKNLHLNDHTASLKRCLSLFDLICYGVGCSVGAGVYSLIGIGASITGPSISISFLVSGIACIFTSLTYSEFAARVPITGSAYSFVYVTFGELAAWLIGWNLMLGYGISAAGIARSWASYVVIFMRQWNIQIPHEWIAVDVWGMSCSAMAAALIVVLSVILLAGVHESAKFNMVVTGLNVAVLVLVIAVGSTQVDVANWEPFAPEGVHGVMQGAGVIFFAYLGFDMVACLAEEVPDPQTNVPRGIIGSLLISIMAPVAVLGTDVPIVNAFDYQHLPWVSHVVSFGSMFGLTTAAFTCLMGQPRIFYQMSKDVFTFVNAGLLVLRFDTTTSTSTSTTSHLRMLSTTAFPVRLLSFVVSSFATCLAINVDLPTSVQLALGSTVLLTYWWIHNGTLHPVCSTTVFVCPWVPAVPCLGIFSNTYMMTSLPLLAWYHLLSITNYLTRYHQLKDHTRTGVAMWMGVGIFLYGCYGVHHSKLGDNEEESQPLI
ncbi:hypothetical protein DYB25_005520 [Aphanomyces astaci]|uniref:Cationic amino acid transporter C-terminal domain-containing protein n=1 Tax=Aphanomyces astaci TaxID=112090 RepID=A0A397F416_APHAT|nr:hypothetical protein DYB25_005520 [Aphanomyces astaci]RHZ07537.1 hypothetical protein DYB26_009141 [Aphanomyces astaci]RHZ14207.1 hypothetical protein DYB31_010886 [Aphanomyces astaci]